MTTTTEVRSPAAGVPGLTRADLLEGRALVGGDWIDADGGAAFEVTDPADGRVIAHVADLGAAETARAVDAAHTALPAWRGALAGERERVLRRWHDRINAHVDDLARLMTAEQGKPLAEARGEVTYAAAFLDWFAGEARRVRGEVLMPHQPDRRILVLRQPVGVVAAITPWNFPAAMIARKVAPALAAGCTVVLKPSELTPLSALALARLAHEAGLPPGVLNVVTGRDAEAIGSVVLDDPRVRKLTFTGSTPVGKRLAARAAGTMKRISMELGGNAPFLVFDDADLGAAIDGVMASKFRNTGQTCVCANRILVQAGVHDAFVERLAARAAALRVGPGLGGETDQGPLIDARAVQKVAAHVSDAVSAGAHVLTGGGPHALGGNFWQPTVLAGVRHGMRVTLEETFGPLAPVMRFEDDDEGLALANATPAGLAAYAFTRDMARTLRIAERLEFGIVGMNTGLVSSEIIPFGGIKESGIGREGSHLGLNDFLDVKSVCIGGVRP
jgi:succinate-semialdehyde dehydrogenase/glutarate-semialdehyde dehydrogenase